MPTAETLPVISIAPFLTSSPTSERAEVAARIHDACRTKGFFYITGFESVVGAEELETSLATAREFFGRPEAEKRQLKIRKGDGARGWQQLGSNVTQYRGE